MRLMKSISHTPGKDLVTTSSGEESEKHLEEQMEMYVRQAVESLPASEGRLNDIQKAQQDDPEWPTTD